jgi:diketogulonate reductase-like aldo/keto reductase
MKTVWKQMEAVQKAGLARSIGVSNFDDRDLAELLEHAKVVPAANQVCPSSRNIIYTRC